MQTVAINQILRFQPEEPAVVKLYPSHMDKTGKLPDKFGRREYVRILNVATGKWAVRQVMGATTLTRIKRNGDEDRRSLKAGTIALDYDTELELGIFDLNEHVALEVTKANIWHKLMFTWNHPERTERLFWRFGTVVTLVGFKSDFLAILKWAASIF